MCVVLKVVAVMVCASLAGVCGRSSEENDIDSDRDCICIPHIDCPAYKALAAKRPKTIDVLVKMAGMECNLKDNVMQVCCPSTNDDNDKHIMKTIEANRMRTKLSNISQEHVLRSKRQAANLLPKKNTCGKQDSSGHRILGGKVAELDEFPWMVLLEYKNKSYHGGLSCGGAIISSRYVLTAAHCVTGPAYNSLGGLDVLRIGEYNTMTDTDCVIELNVTVCADPSIRVHHEKLIPHPNFNNKAANDIALIRLKETLTFSPFIQPICLPTSEFPNINISTGTVYFVSGWGITEQGSHSDVKLKVEVPITDQQQCALKYKARNISVASHHICAGKAGKDSCTGDSGGPLMQIDKSGSWFTVGVVSMGPFPCGQPNEAAIYTNVQSFVKWIQGTVK